MTDSPFTTDPGGEVACTYHPETQTRLRCSRCGKPICPRCGIRTPVGMRCPECAGVRAPRSIRTGNDVLVRAAGAGLAVAAVAVALWVLAPDWKFYLSLLLGFGVAEAMAKIASDKRGADLQLAGIGIVAVAIVAVRVLLAQRYGVSVGDGFADQGIASVLQMRLVPDLLFAALSVAIVWVRFR